MQRRTLISWLALLCAAFLAGGMATFVAVGWRDPSAMMLTDSPTYLNPARALLTHGTFSVDAASPGAPEIIRTPGYPLFLAAAEFVFGRRPQAAILLQILVATGTLLLAYACARSLWRSSAAGLAAAVLTALDPTLFHLAQLMLSETLFTFLLMCAIWAACRIDRAPGSLRWAALLGSALGAAALTRPIAEPLILLALVFLAATCWRRGFTRRRALALLAAGIVPWLVLDAGWRARNWAVAGEPRLSAISSVNLYLYRAAGALAQAESIPFEEARQLLQARAQAALRTPSASERYTYYRREGWAILRQHPLPAIQSTARGATQLVFSPGAIDLDMYLEGPLVGPGPISDLIRLSPREYARKWLARRPLVCVLLLGELVLYGLLYCGTAITLVQSRRAIRRRWPIHCFLLGTLALSIALSAGPEAYARFRAPLVPILALYAASALLAVSRHRLISSLWRFHPNVARRLQSKRQHTTPSIPTRASSVLYAVSHSRT